MTKDEYNLTFGQWAKYVRKEDIILDKFGDRWYQDKRKSEVTEKWHDVWEELRKAYRMQEKSELIIHAMETIKAKGFTALLKNWDNAHIISKSKSGKVLSYYATTGTITGYKDTTIKGLDEYIRLLNTI